MTYGSETPTPDGLPVGIAFCNAVKAVFEGYEGEGLSVAALVGSIESVLLSSTVREDEPLISQQLIKRLEDLVMEYLHKGLPLTETLGALRCLQFDIMRTAVSELS